MYNTQTDVGEAHTGYVLAQCHAFTAFGCAGHSAPQRAADDFDGFQVHHVGHFPGALGDVTLDGVSQGIHTGGSSQALGHGGHHIGVDHSHNGDVMGIHANEFAVLLHVGDYIVDGNLSSSTGSGGNGNDGNALVLGGHSAFQADYIGILGVGNDNSHTLGGIHCRAATDGNDGISACGLECSYTFLNVLDGGVSLDLAVHFISDASLLQQVGHLGGNLKTDQVRVGYDQDFLKGSCLDFINDAGNGTGTKVGCFI